mmetsp:Transcript_21633/g.74295  ORF Transcript_21633/g.74295 Transcript_21633/m.74295 type:complete len:201 (-) Transcript_21633:104-706(-)
MLVASGEGRARIIESVVSHLAITSRLAKLRVLSARRTRPPRLLIHGQTGMVVRALVAIHAILVLLAIGVQATSGQISNAQAPCQLAFAPSPCLNRKRVALICNRWLQEREPSRLTNLGRLCHRGHSKLGSSRKSSRQPRDIRLALDRLPDRSRHFGARRPRRRHLRSPRRRHLRRLLREPGPQGPLADPLSSWNGSPRDT